MHFMTSSEFIFICSEEIRGEILFVLYKLSVIEYASNHSTETDVLSAFCPKLLYLSLEALMKTQNDDVRLNCVGLATSSYPFVCVF